MLRVCRSSLEEAWAGDRREERKRSAEAKARQIFLKLPRILSPEAH